MQCIPFDEWFSKYLTGWISENGASFGNELDRMEEQMPAVYEKWLATPAEWLSGVAPGAFFEQYEDAAMLVAWMLAYLANHMPVPDPLLNRITTLGERAEESLLGILLDPDASSEAQIHAISLLTELDSVKPMPLYIELIQKGQEREERVDHAAQALAAMGPMILRPVLDAAQNATRAGKEAFLDILCDFPGEPETFDLGISLFLEDPARKALYASFLGKLGDDRAVPFLQDALKDPALPYLDYIEIRNAMERLGGELSEERDFFDDPGFEALKRMK